MDEGIVCKMGEQPLRASLFRRCFKPFSQHVTQNNAAFTSTTPSILIDNPALVPSAPINPLVGAPQARSMMIVHVTLSGYQPPSSSAMTRDFGYPKGTLLPNSSRSAIVSLPHLGSNVRRTAIIHSILLPTERSIKRTCLLG
jgi:hypothetical protein